VKELSGRLVTLKDRLVEYLNLQSDTQNKNSPVQTEL